MPFSQKNRLPCRNQSGYISVASHKTGAGFRSLLINKAHNRASGFFVRTALPHIFSHQNYGGAYGADFGRAGFCSCRLWKPCTSHHPEFSTSGW